MPSETKVILIHNNTETIFSETAEENGEVNTEIGKEYVGKDLSVYIRTTAFVFDHELKITVQHWGLCEAVRIRSDPVYNGNWNPISEEARSFLRNSYAEQKYLIAHSKSQYIVRNFTTRTVYFWFALSVTSVAMILRSFNVPEYVYWITLVITWGIRAFMTNTALGLRKPPIYF